MSLKSLLIPVLAFAVAAAGCGGSSNDAPGDGAADGAGASAAAGAGGSVAGTDAGADGGGADGAIPVCNADTFCQVFLAYCPTTPGYTTLAECMTTFANVGATNPYGQMCEVEHLCIAIFDTGSDRVLHCSHAAGQGGVCVIAPI